MLSNLEKILDGHVHEVVDIDKIQYEFMPKTRIVDAFYSQETY